MRWNRYCDIFKQQSVYFRDNFNYKYLGKGDIDLFKLFLEKSHTHLNLNGKLGMVIPGSFTANQGCAPLRKLFFEKGKVEFLHSFENRWPTVFSAVDDRKKFIVFSAIKGGITDDFKCSFMKHDPNRLFDIDNHCLRMNLDQVKRLSPTDYSIMEFKNQKEIDFANKIYNGWPMLEDKIESTWNVTFRSELHMSQDSALFLTRKHLIRCMKENSFGTLIQIFQLQIIG